ncbi:MAG TPA: hypothetical protein VG347_13785 [Verrucomicrobiae bacterium]|nr:hypothetical protein [Verrucomicrobiae bacterium]
MATGKICRLPRAIREQVNQRLDDGVPGKQLVVWLNGLPEVRALLASEFGGAAINEQNLTNWKQGGFREWRMREDMRALVPPKDAEAASVTTEQLRTVVTARYLVAVREWQRAPVAGQRRWRQMRVILHDVLKLQKHGYKEKRLALAEERMEWQQKTEARQAMTGMLQELEAWPEVKAAFQEAFGGYERRKTEEANEAELGPIKVNQGGFKNGEGQSERVDGPRPAAADEDGLEQIKVAQGERKITFLDGLEGMGASDGSGEIFFAGDEVRGEDRPSHVRKRPPSLKSHGATECHGSLPQSRDTAIQNGGGQDRVGPVQSWILRGTTPQSACGAGGTGNGPFADVLCSPLSGMVGKSRTVVGFEIPVSKKTGAYVHP